MSKQKYTQKSAGLGKTSVETRESESVPLTAEEERVVRMVHGLAEADDFEISYAQTPEAEVNARLKVMEATLLAKIHGRGPLAQAVPQALEPSSDLSAREKILAKLKKIEELD